MRSLSFAALAPVSAGILQQCTRAAQRPNIIFLLTDDQRWDTLGAMGNKIIQTPNMDALAKSGVMFSNAFVTTSICCTSRASIFLGQYARRHGINDFKTDFTPRQLSQTYDILLKNAGYRIGFIGKYGVGKHLPAEEYDYWKGIPGQPKYETRDETDKSIHLTRLMGQQAVEFLQTCQQEKPFCLSISFKAPHVQDSDPRQFIYDPAYKNLYREVKIPLPETAADKFFYDEFPPFFTTKNEGRRRWEMRFATPEMYQKSLKGYYRLITGVDVVVGKIRKELQRSGLAANTVIILLGDNGFFLGEHGLAGKWYGYEESIRVPLVIYDPRLSSELRGQVRPEIALNIDVAPTILSLTGVPVPAGVQGKSLLPLLKNQKTEWRKRFFYEHLFDHPGIPKSEGVRTTHYTYLRYIEQSPVYEELFDLKTDPHEIRNLAGSEDYREILRQMRKMCDDDCQSLK